ncbi:MAG: choice-of-anchor D domain-containing protein [bacterium]
MFASHQGTRALICALFVLYLGSGTSAWGQPGTDVVGIYWDPGFTRTTFNDVVAPSLVTGYLVLHNPSAAAGVGGWELCADIEGPGQFSGWTLEGQTINVSPPPCFTVGIGGPPLPPGENVLLATFQILVEGPLPITISLEPKYNASIPGSMAYLDGADPETVIPLATTTGTPQVAWINDDVPVFEVSPSALGFWDTIIGQAQTKAVTVTNAGSVSLELDIALAGDCPGFSLPGVSGPLSVGGGESVQVLVRYEPQVEGHDYCTLVLGGVVPDVPLEGTARHPILDVRISPDALDFGPVAVGAQMNRSVTIQNLGEVPVTVTSSLDDATGAFGMLTSPGVYIIGVSQSLVVGISFLPPSVGDFTAILELGDQAGSVPLSGQGVDESAAEWTVTPEVDFGLITTNVTVSRNVVVDNVGIVPFVITASVVSPENVFVLDGGTTSLTLAPGMTYVARVDFTPAAAQPYSGFLDLGAVVGQVPLSGEGTFDIIRGEAPSSVSFAPVPVGQSAQEIIAIRNTGTLPFTIDPVFMLGGEAFSIASGGGLFTLNPGMTRNLTLEFSPPLAQSYSALLVLGGPFQAIPVTGTGVPVSLSWTAPTEVDFGNRVLGSTTERSIIITNTGNSGFQVIPDIVVPSEFHPVSGFTARTLEAGASLELVVSYLPQTTGPVTGTLELGPVVPAITLLGEGRQPVTSFFLTPEELVLPPVAVGYPVTGKVTLANTGDTFIEVDPTLADETVFAIVMGGGVTVVAPGTSHQVQVQFESPDVGSFATLLSFGGVVPDVPIDATAEAPDPACSVEQFVNFGVVTLGWREQRYLTVTNSGNVPLSGTPVDPGCTYFGADTSPIDLGPGQQALVSVTFQPLTEGSFNCTLDLGIGECGQVMLSGTGQSSGWGGSGENIAEVYWDPSYFSTSTSTNQYNQILTGYLVLSSPSDISGVGGWEGCLELDGDAEFMSWNIQGQNINVETPPCFMVGIGGAPLPFADHVLLATFQCLVPTPWSQVDVLIGPTRTPSIPGYSAWIPWADLDNEMPMQQFPGQVIIGVINSGLVGVEAPTPRASVTAGGVELTWQLADETGDRCHVYRRAGEGETVRLTDAPLQAINGRFSYRDPAVGIEPGSVLHYSYAIVSGGTERARSPEVSVTLGGLPAALTRLLPNVPNPFNPMTEVRFELDQPGQVRITIYDVTGRRVAGLVDEALPAGPHSRIWQGRDDAGRPLPSGAYYLRLEAEGRVDHRKVMLLK